jgi:spore cortex formation protein SpoVR/YcgB (stage V sporulation)
LSSGVAKGNTGNCAQVIEIVTLLSDNGNQTVYGIIDWDKTNNHQNKVHVLGWGQRYSIENYIFDPIILANFLIREVIKPKEYFGLQDNETSFDFVNFSKEKLQAMADIIIRDIAQKTNVLNSDKVFVQYLGKDNNGLSLLLPNWYLHHQGHELEELIKETYPPLRRFPKLKQEIINKVIGDLPAFISSDFVTLLQGLHN